MLQFDAPCSLHNMLAVLMVADDNLRRTCSHEPDNRMKRFQVQVFINGKKTVREIDGTSGPCYSDPNEVYPTKPEYLQLREPLNFTSRLLTLHLDVSKISTSVVALSNVTECLYRKSATD